MKKLIVLLTCFLVALLALTAVAAAKPAEKTELANAEKTGLANAEKTGLAKKQVFKVKLHELNNSGVTGIVLLKLENGELKVMVQARGLEPNQVHMQHIHGMTNGSGAVCPPPAADNNPRDGIISFAEGLPFFGPVLRALFLQGLTIYPTADSHGKVRYRATFSGAELAALQLGDFPLENRVVVLHGLTVNGAYSPSLPVACGEIMAR
ncbi:MAG: hypothetical protein MUQ56_00695 [Thermoleophilia bacterium]|nr:hypothetical protein [Thermoleophilia bacterium]